MSDETIQYITTDYLIEVDGGEPAPAPIEYIVELGQVGVQGVPGEKGEPGFSPTVGYILSDDTFRINITNQDGVTQTPNLYDYFADKNGYLKIDGSNAEQDLTINQARFKSLSGNAGVRITNINGRGNLQLSPDSTYLQTGSYGLVASYANQLVSFGNVNGTAKVIQATADKVYYEAYSSSPSDSNNEIATIGDIGNGTITLTQGGVTKGTFTTNQSGNATIDLDAGGGSITNPLEIISDTGNQSIFLGFEENSSKLIFSEQLRLSDDTVLFDIPIHAITTASNPISITKNDTNGLSTISLNIDDTTIKVNQSGQLYAVGGGTTYTAGTGIDITSDVISIDTDVVAQLSDIPDVSNFVTNSSLATTLQNYVLSSSLATVATSGSYNDLLNKPTIPTNSDYVDLTSAQTITGKKTFSGAEIETNKIITLKNNAIIRGLHGSNYSTYLSSNSTSLLLGNESNNIKLRGNTTRPVYRTGGTDYDIALSGDIPSLATTSTAGIVQPDGSTITVNNGVISATPARNIGEIVHSTIPLTDAGLHLLDGSLISGSGSYADFVTYIAGLVNDYPDLFETEANWQTSVTTYGVCGKFVYDSTNNTVRLPKITGIIEGTVDATALGDLVEAGLPNITGDVGAVSGIGHIESVSYGLSVHQSNLQGAFYANNTCNYTATKQSQQGFDGRSLGFNASNSSSIYGNSSTVQPQTIKAFIYIVIATSAKTEIQVDIDEIATDLNGKIDTDFTNINSTGIETLLSTIYPVGAVYISTTATCPLASLMPNATWTKKAEDRVLQGSSSTHTEGTTIAAGLPNITGFINSDMNGTGWFVFNNSSQGGSALYPSGYVSNAAQAASTAGMNAGRGQTLYLDASWSNTIYGNSSTVQPPAYVVSIWERTA